ncbi:hypothetical protein J4G08_10450 [Candidatus Poribacteria bacterium]|nr:hypothetical protein [Candidatus Poribacteria bacterium]
MSDWIKTINQKTKWMKWSAIVFCFLIGIYNFVEGYRLLQDEPGERSGTLLIISGSFFLISGVLQFLSRYLTANVVGAISSVIAVVIFFIA